MQVQLEREARLLALEGRPLARGGEATLHELPAWPALIAKVYHQPTPQHADKVAAMLTTPPADPTAASGHASIAWPVDRLLATDGGFLGYVMPRVHQAHPLMEFYSPRSRRRLCPGFHHGYLLRTARNLAAAVRALHERDYVIGDLNESNVLVNNRALVTLVDTDSFQVPAAGRVYRCPVGKAEYTPPELQEACFADFDRGPEHDAFALAVLVFQLLMQGVHPFAGRFTGAGEPAEVARRIALGHWPYARSRPVPYEPPPHAPPFTSLHPGVQDLLRRCFEAGHARSALRPTAAEWQEVLRAAEQELVSCSANTLHFFQKGLPGCPWCELSRRLGRDPFPEGVQDEVEPPTQPTLPRPPSLPAPVPSSPPLPAARQVPTAFSRGRTRRPWQPPVASRRRTWVQPRPQQFPLPWLAPQHPPASRKRWTSPSRWFMGMVLAALVGTLIWLAWHGMGRKRVVEHVGNPVGQAFQPDAEARSGWKA